VALHSHRRVNQKFAK